MPWTIPVSVGRRNRKEGDPEFDLGGEVAVRSQEMTAVAGSGDTQLEQIRTLLEMRSREIFDRISLWSERMQEEARLRAARPAFLNEAATGSE